jgi:hypothetical protein
MARRGHHDGEYLFHQYDLFSAVHAWKEGLKAAIEKADPNTLQNGNVDEAAQPFLSEFQAQVPELTEGAISVDVEEAQVDVTGDIHYGHFGPGKLHVPGIRASYFVPFTGDPDMFRVKPSRYSSLIPAAAIENNELRFTFERAGQDVAATKKAFDEELGRVKEYLGWLREGIDIYNQELLPIARERIAARRARLAELEKGKTSLGISIRGAAPRWACRSSGPHA